MPRSILSFSVIFGALLLVAACSGTDLAAADTEYTSIDQLPAPVQATLKQEATGGTLTRFEKEEKDGVATYTAEIPGPQPGTIIEFTVRADGKLLKSEIEDIAEVPASAAAITTLGDLTAYRSFGIEVLQLVAKKDFTAAVREITDLEAAWDKAEETLRPKNGTDWKVLDKAIDKALAQVRADKPDVDGCTKVLKIMIGLCPIPAAAAK